MRKADDLLSQVISQLPENLLGGDGPTLDQVQQRLSGHALSPFPAPPDTPQTAPD